jgi:hypothetical protein
MFGPGEAVIFFAMLGVGLLIGGLIEAVLFRLAKHLHDRNCAPHNVTADVTFPKAFLIGFIYTGTAAITRYLLIFAGIALSSVITPGGIDRGLLIAVAVLGSGILAQQIIKILLLIGFIPCRAGAALVISLIWFAAEAVIVLIAWGLILAWFAWLG